MSARDNYPIDRESVRYTIDPGMWKDMCDEIDDLRAFALAAVSMERTEEMDALIATTPDRVLALIDADMLGSSMSDGFTP